MRVYSMFSRNSILTAIGIVLVALSVFGWGVQYRVSLYNAPASHRNTVPEAKLLSPRERTEADTSLPTSRPGPLAVEPVLFAVFAILLAGFTGGNLEHPVESSNQFHSQKRRHFGASFFSFRPPPSFSSAS